MLQRVLKVTGALLIGALIFQIIVIAPQSLDNPEPVEEIDSTLETEFEKIIEEEDPSKVSAQTMIGVKLVEASPAGKEWDLQAEKALTREGEKSWEITGVNATFFGTGETVFYVSGRHGIVYLDTKNIDISGDVIVKSSNGYTFRIDKIKYWSADKRLASQEPVTMEGPDDKMGLGLLLTGVGLEASLESSLMEVMQKVKATKEMKRGKSLSVTSQRAQFSAASNHAKFIKDVIIDYLTMRLTGPEATFNYDRRKNFLSSMTIQGGVKVSDVDKWATSNLVNVDFQKNKYVFSGDPRLVQNNDELRGDEIVFLDGGNRVKVKNTKTKFSKDKSEL